MNTSIKQVVEISQDDFNKLIENLDEIKNSLRELGAIRQPEYLTVNQFMDQAKISRWKFNELRNSFRLRTIRRGKKIYIPANEVSRYFEGKMDDTVGNS